MSDTYVSVPLAYSVCRWCGCPYAVPAALSGNVIVRCPNGHSYGDSTSVNDLLSNARNKVSALLREISSLRRSVASKNGYIRRLKERKS